MQTEEIAPKRRSQLVQAVPVYYGWIILVVGAIGIIMTSPGQTYVISVFIDHFIDELGLSRGLVSTLYTIGTLSASFALPVIGRQLDKRGSRLMMTLTVIVFAFACVYMSFVRNAVMLGIGFFFLRMLGQGSLSLISRNVINQWWVRRRGMVMGMVGVVTALLGSGSFPGIVNALIPQYGWRITYILLGCVLMVVMLPISVIFVRNRPEEYGLAPDGASVARGDTNKQNDNQTLEENWTLQEVLNTPVFWLIIAGTASQSMLGTGLAFHIFSIFEDSGLSSTIAASVFLPIAATGAIVQLTGGYLIDRMPVRILLTMGLVLQSVTLIMAPSLFSIEIAYTYGVLSGIRTGLQAIVGSVIWAKYFGRQHLGSITGFVATIGVASSALGPMLFGVSRDWFGGYGGVLTISAILPFLLAIATILFVKPPKRKMTMPSSS
ncbi:MAG: MFS transporter [Chloroflexota bacterium]